jgi:hypothetical protein
MAVVGIAGCTGPRSVPAGGKSPGWPARGSSAGGQPQALLVCNGSTRPCPDAKHYTTVQSAVDAAHPGDWILIWPGIYHEKDARHHAGVLITTPDLHIRGMSRSGVVIDGSRETGKRTCPSAQRLQDFTPRDGIEVWDASNVTIENLTVCDYLSGAGASDGNEIWWNGGDGSGRIGMHGFYGSYLTATSMFHPADIDNKHLAQFGIYIGNTAGPGQITHSYASNMAAGAFYIGACQRSCSAVLANDEGTSSALGYLGTNSGGRIIIKDSVFSSNRTGMAPSSLNNDDAPPPQDGRCPNSKTQSCTVIEHNTISDNNNANAPVYGITPAVGVGIELDGGQFDTVVANRIIDNGSWGVIANDSVSTLGHLPHSRCQGGYANIPARGLCLLPARGNLITRNIFTRDGAFANPGNADLATAGLIPGSAVPRNCFYGNEATGSMLTSAPEGIEGPTMDGPPCQKPGTGNDTVVLQQLACSTLAGRCLIRHSRYPRQTMIAFAPLPSLEGMADPCAGVPRNAYCPSPGVNSPAYG